MFHAEDKTVRDLLFKGNFGLERETLRVTDDGYLAQTPNPFPGNPHIVRDFSEHQVEINTGIQPTPAAVIEELAHYDKVVQTKLANMEPREYLWPFSNPPYLRGEQDIPIAQFEGEEANKTAYREYLSDRYGRYKMTFSGIHFNYSFADELLQADFALSAFAQAGGTPEENFNAYRDDLYLTLAERCVAYGWIMSAITAASPLMDSSFVELGHTGEDLYFGLGTVRCSELGYWNCFSPVLDYSSVKAYAASLQRYVELGFIKYPSELYYPVRVKPRGAYSMEGLVEKGISHIELRMYDLNPTQPIGISEQDVLFSQLLLVWLASTPRQPFTDNDQIQAIQNFKNAAHYDLRTVKLVVPNGEVYSVNQAALNVLDFMEEFFRGVNAPKEVMECIAYQRGKFADMVSRRYTHLVRYAFSGGFVAKGMELARQRQEEALAREDSFI